jgi:ribosomal-protein-alanine N-acetyltransferase
MAWNGSGIFVEVEMHDHRELKTERLLLQPLDKHQAQPLFSIFSNPEAMRYWHAPPHRSIEETKSFIDKVSEGPDRAWAIVLNDGADGGEVAGFVHVLCATVPVGMGYMLHPRFWGRGIAFEAVQAVLHHAFEVLELTRVELWINSENARSLALADRLGFVRRGAFRAKYAHREAAHELTVLGLYAAEDRTHPHATPDQFYSCVPVLSLSDIEETVRYYCDRLGFRLEFMHGDPPAVARVYRSEWSIPGNRVQFQRSSGPTALTGFSLYFEVGAGIDALFEDYRSRGVAIEQPPETKPWGRREFAARDCNGVVIRFATPA